MIAAWKESYDKPREHIKKQRYHFANKGLYNQNYGFSNSHVRMSELDHREGWALKNWCFWTTMLDKTLENHLDGKEIKPVSPKGNQPWIFIGRTDAEAEAPVLRHLICRADSLEKTLMPGKFEAGREGSNRGWDGWMASLTWWTWIWASSRIWKRAGKPVLGVQSKNQLLNWMT